MKKSLLILGVAVAASIFGSCQSLYTSEMSPTRKYSTTLLPPLTIVFNGESFETVFGSSHTSTQTSGFATGHVIGNTPMALGSSYSQATTYRVREVNDLKTIFENDVNTNICEKYGQNKGFIECGVTVGASGKRIGMRWLGVYPGLGVPFLLGMPTTVARTQLQIRVNIYDKGRNLVGSYTSQPTQAKAYVALYHGYSGSNAVSKAAWDSFKTCMNDIKSQIAQDRTRLARELR